MRKLEDLQRGHTRRHRARHRRPQVAQQRGLRQERVRVAARLAHGQQAAAAAAAACRWAWAVSVASPARLHDACAPGQSPWRAGAAAATSQCPALPQLQPWLRFKRLTFTSNDRRVRRCNPVKKAGLAAHWPPLTGSRSPCSLQALARTVPHPAALCTRPILHRAACCSRRLSQARSPKAPQALRSPVHSHALPVHQREQVITRTVPACGLRSQPPLAAAAACARCLPALAR